jgi:hypothetical protein
VTLDEQSFWLDELVTVSLIRGSFDHMVRAVPMSEATPYVYYVLAWPWSRVFGLGEFGLRSLSALVGAAIVPVGYAAGAVLVSRRAGLIAAALLSVNPLLVWYAQESRAYSLFAFFAALSVLFFALALRGRREGLPGWAIASALAVATHYFAVFVVLPEAIWLLYRLGNRRRTLFAALVPAATVAVHLPLVLQQRTNAEAVGATSLASRVAGIPKALVVGYSFPYELAGSVVAAVLVTYGLVLVAARAEGPVREGALVAGGIAAAAVVVPVALTFASSDVVVARNMIACVVPGAICVAAGFASSRVGVGAAVVLCLMSLAITVAVSVDARYGRTDWRGAGEQLDAPAHERAIVVTPFMNRSLWAPYVDSLREPSDESVRVREIAVLGLATEGGFSAGAVTPPRRVPAAPPGFVLAGRTETPTLTLVVFRADEPVTMRTAELERLALGSDQPGVLIQGREAR